VAEIAETARVWEGAHSLDRSIIAAVNTGQIATDALWLSLHDIRDSITGLIAPRAKWQSYQKIATKRATRFEQP
jgi:hypothetical protein